jgi:hypothetical protein
MTTEKTKTYAATREYTPHYIYTGTYEIGVRTHNVYECFALKTPTFTCTCVYFIYMYCKRYACTRFFFVLQKLIIYFDYFDIMIMTEQYFILVYVLYACVRYIWEMFGCGRKKRVAPIRKKLNTYLPTQAS